MHDLEQFAADVCPFSIAEVCRMKGVQVPGMRPCAVVPSHSPRNLPDQPARQAVFRLKQFAQCLGRDGTVVAGLLREPSWACQTSFFKGRNCGRVLSLKAGAGLANIVQSGPKGE